MELNDYICTMKKIKLVKYTNPDFYFLANEDGSNFEAPSNWLFGDTKELKLSLENLQAIERGYDLGDIKRKVFSGFDGYPNSFTMAAVERTIEVMMGLIGDKKFSEEDLRLAMHFGQFGEANNQTTTIGFIQSLQQTEWEVEIEMVPAMSNNGNVYYGDIPKLDENGCLILRRK